MKRWNVRDGNMWNVRALSSAWSAEDEVLEVEDCYKAELEVASVDIVYVKT